MSAIVPAFDEAPRIAAVLEVLVAYPGFAEVLVSDDGSTDGTAEVAMSCGARVVRHEWKSGKGAAMARGVAASSGDVLFFCDADIVGLTPDVLDEVVGPVRRGDAEMFVAMIDRRIYNLPLIVRKVPLLGGVRALTRELWQATPVRFKSAFGIESALNHFASNGGGRPLHKVFPGLSQTVKEQKYGLVRGTYWRWRMVLDVVSTTLALRFWGSRVRAAAE